MSQAPSPPPPPPPPPDYTPSLPQILVAPLPDSPSFFWGRTIQGEVFVKGLGERRSIGVKSLTVQLKLENHLPDYPTIPLHSFPTRSLYPPSSPNPNLTSSSSEVDVHFTTSHRFSIPLPNSISTFDSESSSPLPGTLNLSTVNKGEIRWSLVVLLTLKSGQEIQEEIIIEGTPQDVLELSSSSSTTTTTNTNSEYAEQVEEVEERIEKNGVTARLLIDNSKPRLGDLVRLGVEIHPKEREKNTKKGVAVAQLSSQPNPSETLRPLRRVRVELFRRVQLQSQSQSQPIVIGQNPNTNHASTSTELSTPTPSAGECLTLLHASGKSLRYPGTGNGNGNIYPPLRLLFTAPTVQLGNVADQTWGEINMSTKYHQVTFFIRVTIGFGEVAASSTGTPLRDWILQRELIVRPKLWHEPREVVIERGMEPALGIGEGGEATLSTTGSYPDNERSSTSSTARSININRMITDEQMAREAYRQKGRDVVGESGTYRLEPQTQSRTHEGELPPPFDVDAGAGPSNSNGNSQGGGLPTFLESEEQMRSGQAPLINEPVRSERLIPVQVPFDNDINDDNGGHGEEIDRSNWVGRRGSLTGELGTWVEYDGYETFSVAPPSASASFGVGGSMDPPQEGEEDGVGIGVVGGIAARLGLGIPLLHGLHGRHGGGMQLMEQLGLGEGTRVVDLQDDLPPGIDEPSLPALPSFNSSHSHSHSQIYHSPTLPLLSSHPHPHPHSDLDLDQTMEMQVGEEEQVHDPPSFDDSQAFNALGSNAPSAPISTTARTVGGRRPSTAIAPHPHVHGEAPPGYVNALGTGNRNENDNDNGEAGLPPYS